MFEGGWWNEFWDFPTSAFRIPTSLSSVVCLLISVYDFKSTWRHIKIFHTF